MQYHSFKVLIRQDEDGLFVASVPSVPGCHSQGRTYEEVTKNIKEALELCLDFAKDTPAYQDQISYPEKRIKVLS
jgi:predicted RNase H-like HicB family nuclease